jgi:sugar lactone lactonase YvrE
MTMDSVLLRLAHASVLLAMVALAGLPSESLRANPFTPGNVVVVRVGNETTQGIKGIDGLVMLSEHPAAGGDAVNQIPLTPLTLPVGGTAKGFLMRSPGGRYLTLAGNAQREATVVRVNTLGKMEILARAGSGGPGGAPNGVALANGETVCYLSGGALGPVPGLRMVSLGADGPVPSLIVRKPVGQVSAVADRSGRQFLVYETSTRLFSVGELPPREVSPVEFPFVNAGTTGSTGFVLLDRDPGTGAQGLGGIDTLYLASENNVVKFEWSPAGWVRRGAAGYTKFHAITARERNGKVEIFATATGAGEDVLVRVDDDTKFGEMWNRPPRDFVILASSGPAEFLGVALAPETLDLQELSIEEGRLEPAFEPERARYRAKVGTEVVSVSARAVNSSATVDARVNGGDSARVNEVRFPLRPGKNEVEIRVRSPVSAEAQSYSIEVIRVMPPTLATPPIANVSGTLVTVEGDVTQDGGAEVTDRGVVFAPLHSQADPSSTGTRRRAEGGPMTGPFRVELTDLEPGRAYALQSYATNAAGTSYSPMASFATEAYFWTEVAGQGQTAQPSSHRGSRKRDFAAPFGLAVNRAGEVFVADAYNHTIRKISPNGAVSLVAGKAGSPGSFDGTGEEAQFYSPYGLAVAPGGILYVADSSNHCIRKIDAAGAVSTLAGKPGFPGSQDGAGTDARFAYPRGIAIDASGQLYVADTHNHLIRRVSPGGEVRTLAGRARQPGSRDGERSEARFEYPTALAVDRNGTIYVADSGNKTIRKMDPGSEGRVTTLAGAPKAYGKEDGPGTEARFGNPQGIAVNETGTVYVADTTSQAIRMMQPDGTVSTLLAQPWNSAENRGSAHHNSYPFGVATDASGSIYIAVPANSSVRKIFKSAPTAE